MSKLVIVESPAKAHTVGKILGSDYTVKASVGHIRDLPLHALGIEISEDGKTFTPKYQVSEGKVKVVDELVRLARKADEILLASDPDREGESISWHLREVLTAALSKDCISKPFHRVEYNEITRTAILHAFENPHEINMNRVNAQQARRLLDRLVGFKVSPSLRRAGVSERRGRSLSAGRVQSVALRIICERERLIQDFVPETYWEFEVEVQRADNTPPPFLVRLRKLSGKKARITDAETAARAEAFLRQAAYRVAEDKSAPKSRYPAPPFKTSTLQQSASSALGFTADYTMRLAQNLYEAGIITYMRTDSIELSDFAIAAGKAYITETFGAEFSNPHNFTNKASAQGAHEAIRPTNPAVLPAEVPAQLERSMPNAGRADLKAAAALYGLIRQRFLESQMKAAVFDARRVTVLASGTLPDGTATEAELSASTQTLTFPGFLELRRREAAGKEEAAASPVADSEVEYTGNKEDADDLQKEIPPLTPQAQLAPRTVAPEEKQTHPPRPFNEASLVHELEEQGIGRPSTYAAVIRTLKDREYVTAQKRVLRPTEIGFRVNDFLVPHFPELFDIGFTARMESKLDDVEDPAKGIDWQSMLADFYSRLLGWLDEAKAPAADPDAVRRVLTGFLSVREWNPPRAAGKRTFSDLAFVQDIANDFQGIERPTRKERRARERASEKAADEGTPMPAPAYAFDPAAPAVKPISPNQLKTLVRTLLRYRSQVADADTIARELGFEDLAAEAEPREADPNIAKIIELLGQYRPEERDEAFFTSLAGQVQSGKRLSDKQTHFLHQIFLSARERIPDFSPALCESLGVTYKEPAPADRERIAAVLAAYDTVQTWNEPVRRGKRVFDDAEFVRSLREQFEKKGALSEKQTSVLERMLFRYKEQIPMLDELANRYGLRPPEPRAARGAKGGFRGKKAAAGGTAAQPPAED